MAEQSNSNNLLAVMLRNQFYNICYNHVVIINIVALVIIGLLVYFLHYQAEFFAIPKYFPTTPDGVIITNPPNNTNHLVLDKLNFDDNGVLLEWPEINVKNLDLTQEDSKQHAIIIYWVKKALVAMFALDYVHYRRVLQDMRQYFTSKGHERFLEALNNSNNLETIKKGKRVSFAVVQGVAKVTQTGEIEGRKVWEVAVPLLITYESTIATQEPLMQELLAEIKVARISTLQCPFFGLGIYQINFKVLK